jgi:hypothetical protein
MPCVGGASAAGRAGLRLEGEQSKGRRQGQ